MHVSKSLSARRSNEAVSSRMIRSSDPGGEMRNRGGLVAGALQLPFCRQVLIARSCELFRLNLRATWARSSVHKHPSQSVGDDEMF